MRRISLIYPLILLFFTGLFVFQPQASAKQASPAVMQMNTVEGQRVVIPAEGQKTIVHFWTTWCPPCREELPRFQSYYESKQSGVKLVTVNLLNAEKNEQKVKQFIKANKLTFPIVFDKKGEMMKAYKVMTIPTTFFFNEKGELEKTFVGPITVEQMKEWAGKS
ncbi:endospore biogenesis thiol-disulfide oxidoreductase StoA [Bacillus sp. GM2]|jgi:thiol-disulfide isomerase/thioredoxin|uniref:Thioredoxin type domain, electron transporter protein n=2 Tax=Bacillus licheniformis TaxID=1402 RepID=Q65KC3_BACLD|nr:MULTISPECIES: endospore biogenesis thiol-disulfide oxidoreductase StoA [Bacillus]MBJ7885649.1 TlpA family protein disulfide reductase [Bacillaceae bacterium HSR45]MDP4082730.1 endospore biogenesis thiol-disulfide oxidoreductase StoA [Bacillota bacterium]AAU23133.1 Thioredoxin type domain, electron transporter protein [Bacillus licheniformis DSM 13 = ATCC 14580]AAU40491.1 thiol-disulfide oxidoreductase StoA [Bacillus licheniformis DSM 13 = ATCC 14580]AMR10021.1 sporulation protein [Bacillus 